MGFNSGFKGLINDVRPHQATL